MTESETYTRSILRQARVAFDELGCIPFTIGVKLMEAGYMVPQLQEQWAKERN